MTNDFFEKTKLYLRLRWVSLLFVSFVLIIVIMLGTMRGPIALITLLTLGFVCLTNLLLNYLINTNKLPQFLLSCYLCLDVIIIAASLYATGGAENIWWSLMVFPIFISGYLLSFAASIMVALFAFICAITVFALEYLGLAPHLPLYDLSQTLIVNRSFLINHSANLFILYGSTAVISGLVNKLMRRSSITLNESLIKSLEAQQEAENARLAMQNIMEDLARAKDNLEIRVKERTIELEEAKNDLEQKVADRTIDLEQSRKAILHMMKDLKEDMTKLQTIDRLKTEFLSMVSHELRTPITPLKGYLSLLLAGKMGKVMPKQKNTLQILSRQTEHLEDLIGSLLDISRLELGKPIPTSTKPLSIKKVIEDVIEALQVTVEGRGLKLEFKSDKQLPTIVGDDIKLKRVLTNLIGNASKFTPKGGQININAGVEGHNVRIEVVDNGIGLAREYQEKIFEKFFQIDSSYTRAAGGIGMGLAIARELVELHGGKIWAESGGLGRGARFIFTLPVAKRGDK